MPLHTDCCFFDSNIYLTECRIAPPRVLEVFAHVQDSACGENRPRADFTAALTKNKSGWEACEVATPTIIVVAKFPTRKHYTVAFLCLRKHALG